MKTQNDHNDRLSVRLSVIISRLLAGESLELKALVNEFGVSERTLQRDFQQRRFIWIWNIPAAAIGLSDDQAGSTYPIPLRLSVIPGFQGSFRLRIAG